MGEIADLISNVGFPIGACIYMFYCNNQLQKTFSDLNVTLKSIDVRIQDLEKEDK